MKYCTRENGHQWSVTENLRGVAASAEVYTLGERLTAAQVQVMQREDELTEAEREVSRAEERRRAAQDRLRIEKLKTGIA